MIMKHILKFIFLGALILSPLQSIAQDLDQNESIQSEVTDFLGEDLNKNENTTKIILDSAYKNVFNNKMYYLANFSNMSKLFWYYDFPSLDNDDDIDAFFQINECELYEKYHNNEFEWLPIRETMREYLRANRKNFSRNLYFDMPIVVGDYNIEKKSFPVLDRSFNGAERNFYPHPTTMGWEDNFCGYTKSILSIDNSYPRDALFKFIRPLSIQNIKIEEGVARDLVEQWGSRYTPHRYLYVRLYITVTKFLEREEIRNNKLVPVYISYIDGYEIFREVSMENLLYKKIYKTKAPSSSSVKSNDRSEAETSSNQDELPKSKEELIEKF